MSIAKNSVVDDLPIAVQPAIRRKRQSHWKTASLLVSLSLGLHANAFAQQITKVAELSTWPAISQLISYDNRVWFVNSQPYRDTNAADIYSFQPDTGQIDYERSLFSQDTGNPVVHNGLLHWPFEDPRRSAGTGEFAVTDGSQWQWQFMQSGSVMHVHAMNVCNNQLVAVTGSWTGQLHLQNTENQWQLNYDYPAGSASFSRLVNVAQLKDNCIVAAAANGKKEAKLFTIEDSQPVAVNGWPASDRVDGLTIHKNELYAFADTGNERALLRYNGKNTTRFSLPESDRPRALHSNGNELWLATQYNDGDVNRGRLWHYQVNGEGGGAFQPVQKLEQPPVSLTSLGNDLYIGTYHSDGGALWQYKNAITLRSKPFTKTALPQADESHQLNEATVQKIYAELSDIIEDPASTENYARALRRNIGRHPDIKIPEFGIAVSRLLSVPIEGAPVSMFNRRTISRQTIIRWYLLTTMAISGHGRVEPEWILIDQDLGGRSSGKIFSISVAAITAVGWINQNDTKTIDALMQRLNRSEDPFWVKADVIGALSSLTNQRFAYNIDAWNQWWKQQNL